MGTLPPPLRAQIMPTTEPSYVEVERSGGQIPTYRPKVRVDVDRLTADERQRLEELVANAHLEHQATGTVNLPFPDAFTYRLTVKMPGCPERTVAFADQDGHPAALDELADWVRSRGTP
ncbi:protealysin inhibitor emfourin [Burkholderia ubonensis]|uniref:protealysin inhibitor emfourin n=1 Tax=Burkholderia ubonensis TaxID=101571 RepID=UPI000B06ECC7|nr:protealysin inhibitor emfourin [Burkholderia ubonensis]MDY7791648.1 protealysin inhibitor emfourin [Burkholderia ubonensis]